MSSPSRLLAYLVALASCFGLTAPHAASASQPSPPSIVISGEPNRYDRNNTVNFSVNEVGHSITLAACELDGTDVRRRGSDDLVKVGTDSYAACYEHETFLAYEKLELGTHELYVKVCYTDWPTVCDELTYSWTIDGTGLPTPSVSIDSSYRDTHHAMTNTVSVRWVSLEAMEYGYSLAVDCALNGTPVECREHSGEGVAILPSPGPGTHTLRVKVCFTDFPTLCGEGVRIWTLPEKDQQGGYRDDQLDGSTGNQPGDNLGPPAPEPGPSSLVGGIKTGKTSLTLRLRCIPVPGTSACAVTNIALSASKGKLRYFEAVRVAGLRQGESRTVKVALSKSERRTIARLRKAKVGVKAALSKGGPGPATLVGKVRVTKTRLSLTWVCNPEPAQSSCAETEVTLKASKGKLRYEDRVAVGAMPAGEGHMVQESLTKREQSILAKLRKAGAKLRVTVKFTTYIHERGDTRPVSNASKPRTRTQSLALS